MALGLGMIGTHLQPEDALTLEVVTRRANESGDGPSSRTHHTRRKVAEWQLVRGNAHLVAVGLSRGRAHRWWQTDPWTSVSPVRDPIDEGGEKPRDGGAPPSPRYHNTSPRGEAEHVR